jgi:virginiamycin B lyase
VLEFRANKVAHYRDGKFEEFDVGGEFAGLSGLTIAKDGSIWFGLLRRSTLGCIKNGKLSTLKLPRADARPYTLAADQSGNVWYADISGVVGKVPESVVKSR